MHTLMRGEANLATHDGQQAAEVVFLEDGFGLLFLGFLTFMNYRRLWVPYVPQGQSLCASPRGSRRAGAQAPD